MSSKGILDDSPALNNTAYEEGMEAKSILDNPYWREWPKPSDKNDELKARLFVDGYVAALREGGAPIAKESA